MIIALLLMNMFYLPLTAFDFNPVTIWKKYQAHQAYQNQKFDDAQLLMQNRIVDAPADIESLYNAGKAFYAKQDWQHAQHYFDAAAQKSQEGSELQKRAFFDKANSLTQQDKLQEALEVYKKVAEIDPHHQETQKMIQQLEDELKRRKEQQSQEQQKNSQDKNKQQKDKNDKQQSDQKQDSEDQQNNDQKDSDEKDQKGNDSKENNQDGSKEEKDSQNQSGKEKGNDDLKENDKGKKGPGQQEENRQEGAGKDTQSEKQQQPQDGSGKQQEEKQDQKPNEQHEKTPSSQEKNQSIDQHNDGQAKEQEVQEAQALQGQPDERLNDEENKLLKLLDEFDAQALKKMIKTEIKQGMPTHHGQKKLVIYLL